jgi:hypothetical protein
MVRPIVPHDSEGYMLSANHAIGVNAVREEEVVVTVTVASEEDA